MTLQMRDREKKEEGRMEEARQNAFDLLKNGVSFELVQKSIHSLTSEELMEIHEEVKKVLANKK